MEAALASGNAVLVEWLMGVANLEWGPDALRTAIRSGDLDLVKFIVKHEPDVGPYADIDEAAYFGSYEMAKYFHETFEYTAGSEVALGWAADRGDLRLVQFLHEKRTDGCSTFAMNCAAASGHLDVVKYLHENREEGCTTDALDEAATSGHLDVVKFLHEKRHEGCTTRTIDGAATNGHLEIVLYLHENRDEGWTPSAIAGATASVHTEIVTFLYTHSGRDIIGISQQSVLD